MCTVNTEYGTVRGAVEGDICIYKGIPYARAIRWGYPEPVQKWEGIRDALSYGDACPQPRTYYDMSHIPPRLFYHNEFRKGLSFTYSEDCLNLNIWAPKGRTGCPVLVFIHGGGFNGGCGNELYIDGAEYCKRGIVLVSFNYRVGIFGYMTHDMLNSEAGRCGNYGMADQIAALSFVKRNIAAFGGDANNITVMGQSAGAISIQLLCLSDKAKGLFSRAVMLSGGGIMPKFARPKQSKLTSEYWQCVLAKKGLKSADLNVLRGQDCKTLLDCVEETKKERKDSVYNTMPVLDGYYLKKDIDMLLKEGEAAVIPYMMGTTERDMLALAVYFMAKGWAKRTVALGCDCYLYHFDRKMPGDGNGAFHSADLWYVFGTLDNCWRPFTDSDRRLSNLMIDYIASFCRNSNPNSDGLPVWERAQGQHKRFLRLGEGEPIMCHPKLLKLLDTTIGKTEPQ